MPCGTITSGPASRPRSPWLAATARSNAVAVAFSQCIGTIPRSARNRSVPATNAEYGGTVNVVCTRRSRETRSSTSSSRVAAVTLCTTASTVRVVRTVAQRAALRSSLRPRPDRSRARRGGPSMMLMPGQKQ
ncbi:hypothetical protein BJF78_30680 [Pseudonocardia sp. CNS-139]|nr:hypothetical protein BJF78_30680 [Pseudonocardia sp. CNS-139]